MAFKLAFITLVYFESVNSNLNVELLQKANAWLQRRNAGVRDDLLLIGAGFPDKETFRAMLKPYGLDSAFTEVISPDEFEDADETAVGESIEIIASHWIAQHHKNAIPLVKWDQLEPDASYPSDGWWWTGLEPIRTDYLGFAEILEGLVPDSFKEQALTWITLLFITLGLSDVEEEHEEHEASMQAVALSRWLTGFDAAAENNFFEFSASDAARAANLDPLRLGFEAGRNHKAELGDIFDGNDSTDQDLPGMCLAACLDIRMRGVRATLSRAFGGDSLLFWSLYRSIWPDLKSTSVENLDGLLSLKCVDIDDIERPMHFVTEGWIDFSED